jgi:hypothetical protein
VEVGRHPITIRAQLVCVNAHCHFALLLPLLQVFVSGPGLPNLNLVDQPGLIAPNPKSSLPETVERIVTRNANAPGSLILNVVPVEQVHLFLRMCEFV